MSQPEVVQAFVNLNTYINGFVPTFITPNSHLMTISDGSCLDSTGYIQMSVDTGGVGTTINNQISGLNGMAPGETIQNDSVYYVYLEWDATFAKPPGFVVSINPTVPFVLNGYGYYRRVAVATTDSSGNFNYMFVSGNGDSKHYQFDTRKLVLSAGNSTAYANIDLSNVVPAYNTTVSFNVFYTGHIADHAVSFRDCLSTDTASPFVINGAVADVPNKTQFTSNISLLSRVPTITYSVSDSLDSLTLYVYGFQDYL